MRHQVVEFLFFKVVKVRVIKQDFLFTVIIKSKLGKGAEMIKKF